MNKIDCTMCGKKFTPESDPLLYITVCSPCARSACGF